MFLTETWRGLFLSLNSDAQGSRAGRQRRRQLESCFQLPLRGKAGERGGQVKDATEDVGAKGQCSRRLGGRGGRDQPRAPFITKITVLYVWNTNLLKLPSSGKAISKQLYFSAPQPNVQRNIHPGIAGVKTHGSNYDI